MSTIGFSFDTKYVILPVKAWDKNAIRTSYINIKHYREAVNLSMVYVIAVSIKTNFMVLFQSL